MAFIFGKSMLIVETARKLNRFSVFVYGSGRRNFIRSLSSNSPTANTKLSKNENEILKSVFVSQSNNIYTNLALENWLFKNSDFNKHHVLLIWRNAPCVVIGRHQNPWIESNIRFLAENGIDIARRDSGGGTVYHDKGNVNLTFFTPRERYDRKHNLKIIKEALKREWDLDVDISQKDDLLLNNCKVSGTASKLGRPNAYHHCTLLVNVNKKNLKESLTVNKEGFDTKATQSIPSHIMNLTETTNSINYEKLLPAIGWEYLRRTAVSLKDGGKELASRQRGFQFVNPTDQWFPGLSKIRDDFAGWDWKFGKTPKFTVTRAFPFAYSSDRDVDQAVRVTLGVEKGEITDVSFTVPEYAGESVGPCCDLLTALNGQKYSSQTFDLVEKLLGMAEKDNVKRALRA